MGGRAQRPVAIYNAEQPRTRWDEILLLAERLAGRRRFFPTMRPSARSFSGWRTKSAAKAASAGCGDCS